MAHPSQFIHCVLPRAAATGACIQKGAAAEDVPKWGTIKKRDKTRAEAGLFTIYPSHPSFMHCSMEAFRRII
jgi:hypothetical protein